MLRKIVGWIRHATDEWETVMSNMKVRIATAMKQWYIRPWEQRIQSVRKKNFERIGIMDCKRWESFSMGWDPAKVIDDSQEYIARRRAGRPLLRWTDNLVND